MALNTESSSPAPRNNSFHSNFRQQQHHVFKSPFGPGRQDDSPNFSPYTYSSPIRRDGNHFYSRNKRYYNNSDSSFSSGGSFQGSPFLKQNRPGGSSHGRYGRKGNNQSANINLYYDPSAMEDPWEKLELELEKKESFQLSQSESEDSNSNGRTVLNATV